MNTKVTLDTLRWVFLLPAIYVFWLAGRWLGTVVSDLVGYYMLLNVFVVGLVIVLGARLFAPKYRQTVTWVVAVLWVLYVVLAYYGII